MPLHDILRVSFGDYTWKFIIAVGITPLLYLGHALLRRLMPAQEVMLETLEPEYQYAQLTRVSRADSEDAAHIEPPLIPMS